MRNSAVRGRGNNKSQAEYSEAQTLIIYYYLISILI